MPSNLPYQVISFSKWFILDFPLHLFLIGKRLVILSNNQISFTLNLKLLFTPLYGDYTKAGRAIGFVVRIFQIFFGLSFVLVLAILSISIPLLWYIFPVYLLYSYSATVVLYIFAVFALRLVSQKDTPKFRITQIKDNSHTDAYRPNALKLNSELKRNMGISKDLLKLPEISYLFRKLELSDTELLNKISETKLDFSKLDSTAYEYATKQNSRYIELEQVFLAAFSLVPKLEILLSTYNSKFEYLEKTVLWIVSEREKLSKRYVWQKDYDVPKMSGVGKGMTGRVTPFLNSVSSDLTKMAQNGEIDEIHGHQKIMSDVIDLLGGDNTNILLIGPPGCGKTSIVKGIARKIVTGNTRDEAIRFKRIVNIETSSLLAGTKSAGDISEKIKRLMEELHASGDIILFFDEIHNFVSGATSEDGSTIFSLLEPHIADSKVQFIGATNLANYRKYIEPNGSFSRLFHAIEVPPTTTDETLEILEDVSRKIEKEKGKLVTYPAIMETVKLSEKLIHERVFPDKAIDILMRAVSELRNKDYITQEDIRTQISEVTHVPVSSLSQDESEKLLNIASKLKERVIGQDHAVDQIAKALQRARVGIRDEGKPIASFLFVGTTGVGKTETAKALSQEFFGAEDAMIRLDMSEYQQQDSLSKLIGDPNGNSKGILTEAVRTKPFALILLDEIEKAYASVLLTFLQVLDDGRLTDSTGLTIDFTNTIIIATSNIGTRSIQEVMTNNGSLEDMNNAALKDVREHYAPEFLNRFNGLIVFKPLSKEVVTKIADLRLNKVRKLADEKGLKITFKPELITALVNKGYNPEWGARPLSRVIEDSVESYLALKLLGKEIKMGDDIELGLEVFE